MSNSHPPDCIGRQNDLKKKDENSNVHIYDDHDDHNDDDDDDVCMDYLKYAPAGGANLEPSLLKKRKKILKHTHTHSRNQTILSTRMQCRGA